MRLGVELLATAPTRLHLGSFFESWLAVPAGTLKRSLGRDEYHLAITIGSGCRLAATGRTYICQIDAEEAGLGINQARGPILVPADLPAGGPLILGLRTNVFLDLAGLTAGTMLRLHHGTAVAECNLDDRRVEPEQVVPGRYLVDMTDLM